MALRTIADLPALNIDKIVKDEDLKRNLEESLFEISYMESAGQYDTYTSKHIKFRGLSGLMMDAIINSDFDFYGYKTFYGGIGVSNDLNLSGNFFVNKDVPEEIWKDLSVIINAGYAEFNYHDMQLSTENLTAYVDNGTIKNYDGSTVIVNWSPNSFTVNVPFYAENISCNHLTAAGNSIFTGDVTFTKPIIGCALSARWADLAEMYMSDADYPPGTLVMFGGDAEITVSKNGIANAVITDRPGLVLNGSGGRDGIYKGIALVGRTPVLVSGAVRRFDRLAADPSRPGAARQAAEGDRAVAVALADSPGEGVKLVECAVQLAL